MTTTTTFSIPFVASNADSWGPPATLVDNDNAAASSPYGNVGKFSALPYSPFGRSDRLGRAADFANTHRTMGQQQQDYRDRGGADRRHGGRYHNNRRFGVEDTTDEQAAAEESFQLVDTTKVQTTKRFMNPANKRRQQSQRRQQQEE